MSTKTFVNLPVENPNKSMDFFNLQFTDETAESPVLSEDIDAMLLTREKFAGFANKKVADGTTAEAPIAIAVDSKAEVDHTAEAGSKAGGQEAKPPQDHDFMRLRSFFDLDGHHREMLHKRPRPRCSPKRHLDAKLFCKAAKVHIRVGGADRPVFAIFFTYRYPLHL